MFSTDERLASFAVASSSTSAAKKRQSTKATSPLQWPHPVTGRSAKTSGIPTPETLAKYGFYHSPTSDTPDAVSHFLYPSIQISDWQANDDPLSRLEQALPDNGWSRIFRSQQTAVFDEDANVWYWQTAQLLPTSKEMIQARKESFGSQWPYDGKKGWKPTSKKLAEAGFYFTPTEEESDNAKCVYCNKSLGGWEKSDDPVHEHQRRVPGCAFFNCELREVVAEPAAEDEGTAEDVAEEVVPEVTATKKGGKRAVSAMNRKASTKVTKGKKSTAAPKEHEEEEEEEALTDAATDAVGASQVTADEPVKKGGRKTRSVSTKKLAAKAQAEEDPEAAEEKEQEPAPVSAHEDEDEAVEEPVQILSKKKSATGLGNGMAAQVPSSSLPSSSSARPTRAASRRATKAINLLSDEGLNRKLRRPDEEDLERRELALSDPVPFPAAPSEDHVELATDPVQTAKPKKSRSRSKKLDQEAATPKQASPEPESEAEVAMEEDPVNNTIIEHQEDEDEAQKEPLEAEEEPKRRGGRGAKSSSASLSSTKASSSGSKSRKASAKMAAAAEVGGHGVAPDGPVAFPSMSSEADVEPALHRSSRSVSNALESIGSNSSSVRSSSKRGSTKSSSAASASEAIDADSDVYSDLPNTGSQATIRGAPRSSSVAVISSTAAGRTPLANITQLSSLNLDAAQRSMTVGEWLQAKAEEAAREMRAEGEAQLAELEKQLRSGRVDVERVLRGRA
ncbi:Protein BIR1 [Pseudozyma hubeiensis]|nr:Protein BIR1 [Pseudozyma hubeiensis]